MFDFLGRLPHPLNGGKAPNGGRRRKVALVGAIAHLRQDVPWDDPAWDVWGMNAIATVTPDGRLRADRWFEMHQRCAQSEEDLVWIRACPVPIYVPDDEMAALNPRAVVYPLAAVEGAAGVSYWACSVAYQMALAWFQNYADVAIYGMDFARGDERERTVEWACASYWVGFLRGRGVRVRTPPDTRLARHAARYGVEYEAEAQDVRRYLEDDQRANALAAHGCTGCRRPFAEHEHAVHARLHGVFHQACWDARSGPWRTS